MAAPATSTSTNLVLDMLNSSFINTPLLQDQDINCSLSTGVQCPLPVEEAPLFCDPADKERIERDVETCKWFPS